MLIKIDFIDLAVRMGVNLNIKNQDSQRFVTSNSWSQPQISGIPVGMVMNRENPISLRKPSVLSKYLFKLFLIFLIY